MLKKCANHIGNTYNSISFGVCVYVVGWGGGGTGGNWCIFWLFYKYFKFFEFADIFNKSAADYQKTYQAKLPVWLLLNISQFCGGNPLCLGGFFGGYGRFFFRGMIIERGGTFVRRGNNGVWVGGLGGTFYIKMFKCVWLSCNIWYKTSTDYCFLSSWLSISISDDFRFLYNAYFGGNIGNQYLSS